MHTTVRERTPIPLNDIVGSMNASIRGWSSCFHCRNANGVLEKLKTHAKERLLKRLLKRNKVKDRGIGLGRLPSRQLDAKYRYSRVPTKSGWKTAHARFDKEGQAKASTLPIFRTIKDFSKAPCGRRIRSSNCFRKIPRRPL